jgi:hypothetical protein
LLLLLLLLLLCCWLLLLLLGVVKVLTFVSSLPAAERSWPAVGGCLQDRCCWQ